MKKKRALSPRQRTVSQVDRSDDKTTLIAIQIASHQHHSFDLALSDYWLFADLKRMLQGKRFGSNEEGISKTEVFWGQKIVLHKRHRIIREALEYVSPEEDTMVISKAEFYPKVVLLVWPGTY